MATSGLYSPSLDLSGKRALVTGAGRGIGRACALALAGVGASVTLVSRTQSEIESAAETIRTQGGSADILVADLYDVAASQKALESGEPWNILVNNAGTNKPQAFVDVDEATYDELTDLNVKGAFFVAQAVARKLVATGLPGSLINISSQMGHVGGKKRSVYCATKHALEGLTKAMALDLAEHGVRVNSVCPTFIKTPMTKQFLEDSDFVAETLSKIPIGRLGEAEDVVGAVVFLASDLAALITGSSIMVDGGWTAV